MNKIIATNVSPTNDTNKIKLRIYYKMTRLQHILQNTNPFKGVNHHIVYQFHCPSDECNSVTYIGYTTNTLTHRCQQHMSNGSIKSHLLTHKNIKPGYKLIETKTKVIARYNFKKDLEIAEALLIKEHQPILNKQDQSLTHRLMVM